MCVCALSVCALSVCALSVCALCVGVCLVCALNVFVPCVYANVWFAFGICKKVQRDNADMFPKLCVRVCVFFVSVCLNVNTSTSTFLQPLSAIVVVCRCSPSSLLVVTFAVRNDVTSAAPRTAATGGTIQTATPPPPPSPDSPRHPSAYLYQLPRVIAVTLSASAGQHGAE